MKNYKEFLLCILTLSIQVNKWHLIHLIRFIPLYIYVHCSVGHKNECGVPNCSDESTFFPVFSTYKSARYYVSVPFRNLHLAT